jgi:hypothetical protein
MAASGRSSSIVVVGKVIGVDADVVGFRIVKKTNGFDFVETDQQCLADAVHTVHDAAVVRENDGMGEVALIDEAGMVNDFAAG